MKGILGLKQEFMKSNKDRAKWNQTEMGAMDIGGQFKRRERKKERNRRRS
jgi:hypothetical protein